MIRMMMAGAGLAFATGVGSAATPRYSGQVCPIEDGVRVELEVEASMTAVLIYPTPPGGGWYMTPDGPGRFVHDVPGLGPGEELSFSLILQQPQQYAFPEHRVMIANDCTTFDRDDVLAPPPRGFRQEIGLRDGTPWFIFRAGSTDHFVDETTDVAVTYRLDGDLLTTITLPNLGDGRFESPVPGGAVGQRIEYWYSQTMGVQVMHSALIERVIGEPAPEISWPVVSRRVGRFRDRHPNEWRFDNYVQEYGQGRTFEIEITDWGDRLDLRVTVDGDIEVGDMDFKHFVYNDPYSATCNRPLTGVNLVMEKQGDVFTSSIEDITPYATMDFDFTFRGIPTGPVGQYYSDFFYYRVGLGLFGPEHPSPRRTPVGNAVATRVFSPRFGLAQHAGTMTHDELKAFLAGKIFFETDYADGDLLNFNTRFDCCSGPLGEIAQSSPVYEPGLLGPRFNAASCMDCHAMDGRGATPVEGVALHQLVAQVSIPGASPEVAPASHPYYGVQLNTAGDDAEGRLQVRYELVEGQFDDGEPWTLRRPIYEFHAMESGSLGVNLPDEAGSPGYQGEAEFSPRIAPMLAGLGFLEAVADETILAREDPDDLDGDGISGRANYVPYDGADALRPGRFGWKANQVTLRQQVATAFVHDLGITSPSEPVEDCGEAQSDCDDGSDAVELGGSEIASVEHYLQGLTLPPRRNFEDPDAIAGMHLFKAAKCSGCHVPSMRTGTSHPIESYRDIVIEPFTDLLLHDMGEGLADDRPHYRATGREWRTPPLWALSYVGHAMGLPDTCADPESGGATPNFLHDGRARSIMEAILWHGGEAEASRNAVLGMTSTEREQLLAYVAYPFDDPIFAVDDTPVCPEDLDGSGRVDAGDLLQLIAQWGGDGAADIDGNGTVGVDDLLRVLRRWGRSC